MDSKYLVINDELRAFGYECKETKEGYLIRTHHAARLFPNNGIFARDMKEVETIIECFNEAEYWGRGI